MSAGRIAGSGRVNTDTRKPMAGARVPSRRETTNADQWVRDAAQRELEQAAASLVVIALLGKKDAPMVLEMLGISA